MKDNPEDYLIEKEETMNIIEIEGKRVTCDVVEAIEIIAEFNWRDAQWFESLVNDNIYLDDHFKRTEKHFNKEKEFSSLRQQIFGQTEKMISQYITEYMKEHELGEYISENEFIERYGENYYFDWES